MRKAGQAIILPPNPADYITDWLFEIGPASGEHAISYSEMAAWQGITGVALDPWEARTLRRLSGEYLDQSHKARKPECPAPYSGRIEEERDKVTAQFAAMMRAAQSRGGLQKKGERVNQAG